MSNELKTAVMNRDLNKVEELLEQGVDPNTFITINDNRFPIIMFAVLNGGIDIVKSLLDYDADLNLTDNSNSNSLHYLCTRPAQMYMMELLLDNNIDVNAVDDYNQNPLIASSLHGHFSKVKLLLNHENTRSIIDTNIKDSNGHSALMFACTRNFLDIVELLLSNYGIDIEIQSNTGNTALFICCDKGHLELVELLYEVGADTDYRNGNGDTPLTLSIRKNHTDIAQYLIEWMVDIDYPDKNEQTPLMWASYLGNLSIVESLIINGAGVNIQSVNGNTALIWAAFKFNQPNQKAIIKELLDAGANPEIQNYKLQKYYDLINKNRVTTNVQRTFKKNRTKKRNKAATSLQKITRGKLTRKKNYIDKYKRYKQWESRDAFDSFMIDDEDIFKYLRENDNNFVLQMPNDSYEAWNLDDLYKMYKIDGVDIEEDFNYFYECYDANGTINRNNIDMQSSFIKLGTSNFVVKLPDWIYDYEVDIPEPKIFVLKPFRNINGMVSNAILNYSGSFVSGDHCNQLEPIKTYKLEPVDEEELIKSRQRMNFFHNLQLPTEIQNKISASYRTMQHDPNVLQRTRNQNIEDLENERVAEYADFFDENGVDDLSYNPPSW